MKRTDVKRQDLARALAERGSLSEGQAQDELDRVVHDVVTSLRQGQPAEMPGVGHMLAKPFLVKPMLAKSTLPKSSQTKPKTSKPPANKPSGKIWSREATARKP